MRRACRDATSMNVSSPVAGDLMWPTGNSTETWARGRGRGLERGNSLFSLMFHFLRLRQAILRELDGA